LTKPAKRIVSAVEHQSRGCTAEDVVNTVILTVLQTAL